MSQLEFSLENKTLEIGVDFERGSLFACPDCGKPAKTYDTKKHTWRHMDFFQHQAYLTARVPRVNCSHGCGIKQVKVPWARSNSGFTLLFEALILSYCAKSHFSKQLAVAPKSAYWPTAYCLLIGASGLTAMPKVFFSTVHVH